MNKAFVWYSVFYLLLTSSSTFAQGELTFLFNNTLQAEKQTKWLGAIDGKGDFDDVIMPKADYISKNIYEFSKNVGIAFTNASLLQDDYVIEMYLYLENTDEKSKIIDFTNRISAEGIYTQYGKIIIGEQKSEKIVFQDEEYVHVLFVRNKKQEFLVYANGQKVISVDDTEKKYVFSGENIAQFFVDDCEGHARGIAGGIALFKIFPYQFDEQDVKDVLTHLPKTLRGELDNIIVRGTLKDASTKQFLEGAEVVITSTSIKAQTQTNQKGGFALIGSPVNTYHVRINKAGYVDFDQDIIVTRENKYLNVSLLPLKAGQAIVLESVLFEKGKSEVLPMSYEELDKLAQMMIDNSKMTILLEGHTDNLGSEKLSIKLSQARVNSVKEYLVLKGVSKSHIHGKGIGGARPIADNSTEKNRQLNRRVEFTILKR
jgi:outer membrane protein OmpA-like peptidoglycan-associated protein